MAPQITFSYFFHEVQSFRLNLCFVFLTQISKRKDSMKSPIVVFFIKPLPSHMMGV